MELFIATLLDETGCQFIAESEEINRDAAHEFFADNYPESRIVRIDTEQTLKEEDYYFEKSIWDNPDWDLY